MYNYVKGSPINRFWTKVDKSGKCWIWLASKDAKGYGWFGINSRNVVKAHRFSYELHKGKIPKEGNGKRFSMFVCHHCDNPSCVRPSHLWLGTNADKMRDMVIKGRSYDHSGINNPKTKFSLKQIKYIREAYKNGKRGIVKKLTKKYKVNRNTIRRIVHNYTFT